MPVSLERLACNQAIFREVNERLREISNPQAEFTEYICECSAVECHDMVELSEEEYRAVRSMQDVFVIVPGHERLVAEHVIEENERFMLVEKIMRVDRDPAFASSAERGKPLSASS